MIIPEETNNWSERGSVASHRTVLRFKSFCGARGGRRVHVRDFFAARGAGFGAARACACAGVGRPCIWTFSVRPCVCVTLGTPRHPPLEEDGGRPKEPWAV